MKKILFLFLFCLILLSGCNNQPETINKNQNKNTNSSQTMTSTKLTSEQLQAKYEELGHQDLVSQYDQAVIKTNLGDITVKFYNDDSPLTVNNFLNLAQSGFYEGVKFHRVIKDFMIQGGDPNSKDDDRSNDGIGGPGYKFMDEINDHKIIRGSLAMANSGKNTNGSQFFIVTAPATDWLDGIHTNFGEVTQGINVVNKIEKVKVDSKSNPIDPVIIESIELIAK